MTATIIIEGQRGSKKILGLVDSAATRSFVRKELAAELGLIVVDEEWLEIRAFGSDASVEPTKHQSFQMAIRGTFPNAEKISMEALGTKFICAAETNRISEVASQLKRSGHS